MGADADCASGAQQARMDAPLRKAAKPSGKARPLRRRNSLQAPACALVPVTAPIPRSGDAQSVHVHRKGLCDLFGGYDACFAERSTWGSWRM